MHNNNGAPVIGVLCFERGKEKEEEKVVLGHRYLHTHICSWRLHRRQTPKSLIFVLHFFVAPNSWQLRSTFKNALFCSFFNVETSSLALTKVENINDWKKLHIFLFATPSTYSAVSEGNGLFPSKGSFSFLDIVGGDSMRSKKRRTVILPYPCTKFRQKPKALPKRFG